jgi:hypothetical protein
MAERDPRARQELADGERLGDVVVGAGVERRHLVGLPAARRQHDDRHRCPFPEPSDDLDPVQIGESQIEDYEVGLARGGLDQPVLPGLGLDHAIALARERGTQEAADRRLVLDDEDDRASGRRAVGRGLPLSHHPNAPSAAPRRAAA